MGYGSWCLVLISSHRQKGVHMRASDIFSANDVLANLGVMIAGFLVYWTGSGHLFFRSLDSGYRYQNTF
jgi:Co/Zn/Cd efflux system component